MGPCRQRDLLETGSSPWETGWPGWCGAHPPAPWESSAVGNAILTSAMSTLAFLRLVLRMLGRGTDTRKASAKASESISSWRGGRTPNAGSEGRGRAPNPAELGRRGDPDPGRTVNGRYVCSRKDLLEPSCKRGDLQGKKTRVCLRRRERWLLG